MSRLRKPGWRVLAICAGTVAILLAAGALTLRSDWFAEQVRLRIIEEVERATGGAAEIDSFDFDWSGLRAEVRGFALRGTEPANREPLFEAERIVVGLKVVSLIRRDIDIALLAIEKPRLWIERDEEGQTNLPRPAAAAESDGSVVAPIINLAIRRFSITGGHWRYASHSGTIDVSGEDFVTRASYDPAGPAYRLRAGWRQMSVISPGAIPVAFDAALSLSIQEDAAVIEQGRLATDASTLEFGGRIAGFDSPATNLDIGADLAMADLVEPLKLPLEAEGRVRFDGEFAAPGDGGYAITGSAAATGLAVRNNRVRIEEIAGKGNIRAVPGEIRVTGLSLQALEGGVSGEAAVRELRTFEVEGTVDQVALRALMPRVNVDGMAWSGAVSGPVSIRGAFSGEVSGSGELAIAPLPGGLPLEGKVTGAFDTESGDVSFQESRLVTGASRIDFSGSLRNGLRVSAYSENIGDLLPAMELFGQEAPDPFPIRLENGVAQYAGLLSGVLSEPSIAGRIAIGPFRYADRLIDDAAADFDLDRGRLRLRSLRVRQGQNRLRGDGELSLSDWRAPPESPVTGEFTLERGSVEQILSEAGADLPLGGSLSGVARLTGTVAAPTVIARISGKDLSAYEEEIETLSAVVRYSAESLQIERGVIETGGGVARVRGAYIHQGSDWRNGELDFEITANGFQVSRWKAGRDLREGLEAGLEGDLRGQLQFVGAEARLSSLTGQLTAGNITLDGRELGQAAISARTQGNILVVDASAGLQESVIRGNAEWSLGRNSPGLGQLEFSDLTLDSLQNLGLFGGPETEIYLDGSVDGEIGFAGPILSPSAWRGMAKITRLKVEPVVEGRESDRDLTLGNAGSLLFTIEPAKISIMNARLVGAGTDLEASGTLSYLRRNPWNLQLKGSADLAVLTAFRDDLQAEGQSTIDAVIRGSLLEPQVNGRLEFKDGSFYIRELPNGIEQVNGTILFNRTRATIEEFTSRTGGGNLQLGGFIGFGGEDWVYRLQARADRVRVRYPEGVSTLLDAELDLTGSSTRSLLSGEVEVTRAAFNPSSDFGSLLTESSSVSGPADVSNPFLRGMQFDIALTTATNAEFLTSLTRDIEVAANLRLRGSVAAPVLLGRIGVNRGEIQFFGNRYDIVQGEVAFFNPVKIEPVIAMDLETRIRSYAVMMNFSGPLNKLNFSYRSDPPLQSEEIIALLTVGRTPTYAGSPSSSSPADSTYFQSGGGSFLGHALTAPVSSRLQRFFGVSRIKIDPQLTGIENTPETHVTIEQQISREITLTYVTNLTRTQQQIVRLEWNFHPEWSVYAVRDSNGVFGMDFVYRRRFR